MHADTSQAHSMMRFIVMLSTLEHHAVIVVMLRTMHNTRTFTITNYKYICTVSLNQQNS